MAGGLRGNGQRIRRTAVRGPRRSSPDGIVPVLTTRRRVSQMNFYKYQTKLMLSACEKPPFKCAECYRAFGSQTDLQCHVYDQHGPRPPVTDASAPGSPADAAKHDDKKAAANGDRDEAAVERPQAAAIKAEPERDDEDGRSEVVNVKTERRDDVDGAEDEELIVDVGVNCGHHAAVVVKTSASASSPSPSRSPSPSSTSAREAADGNAR